MGWTETCAVEERLRFVLALEAGEESVSLTCRRFGISRKTGEKWRERYRLEGWAVWPIGLVRRFIDRSWLRRRAMPCGSPGAPELGSAEGAHVA